MEATLKSSPGKLPVPAPAAPHLPWTPFVMGSVWSGAVMALGVFAGAPWWTLVVGLGAWGCLVVPRQGVARSLPAFIWNLVGSAGTLGALANVAAAEWRVGLLILPLGALGLRHTVHRRPLLLILGGAVALLLSSLTVVVGTLARHGVDHGFGLRAVQLVLTLAAVPWLVACVTQGEPTRRAELKAAPVDRILGVAAALFALGLVLGEGAAYVGAGLCLLALAHTDRRFWREPWTTPVAWMFGLWLMWLVAGTTAGPRSGWGWQRPEQFGVFGPCAVAPIAFWVTRRLDKRQLSLALQTFLVGFVVSSVFGLALFALTTFLPDAMRDPFLSLARVNQSRVPWDTRRLVAGGFYLHRLTFSHVALFAQSALIVRLVVSPTSTRQRLLDGAALAIITLAMVLTFTRSALLGLGMAIFFALVLRARRDGSLRSVLRVSAAAGAAFLLLGVVMASIPEVRAKFGEALAPQASSTRAVIWQTSDRFLSNHPHGVGFANYPTLVESAYATLDPNSHRLPRLYAHSLLVTAWAETGLTGAALYVLLWAVLFLGTWRIASRVPDAGDGDPPDVLIQMSMAGWVTLGALWTVGLTHDVFYHKPVALMFAAFCGVLLGSWHPRRALSTGGAHG